MWLRHDLSKGRRRACAWTPSGAAALTAAALVAAPVAAQDAPQTAPTAADTRVTRACSEPCPNAPVEVSAGRDTLHRAGAIGAPATVIDPAFFLVTQALGPVSVVVDGRAFAPECAVLGVCAPLVSPASIGARGGAPLVVAPETEASQDLGTAAAPAGAAAPNSEP